MAELLGTIRTYRRVASRRLAKACYGLVAGGMGALLSVVALNAVGVLVPEVIALAGLGVAFVGALTALVGTVWVTLRQSVRARTLSAEQELTLHPKVRGFVASGAKVLVCVGRETLEFDGLTAGEVRRLETKHASQARAFESGPAARAEFWWMFFVGSGFVVALALAMVGYTIDHLMPMTVYTATFVASLFVLFAREGNVRIGLDGVRMGRDFVPYSALQQLTVRNGRLSLVRKNGSAVDGSLRMDGAFVRALDELVQTHIDAKSKDGEAYEVQSEESFDAWLRRVRGSFDATSFRKAPASVEDAKALLRDAKVPFRVRVAVAVALSPVDPEFVEEALDDLAHPRSASLKAALALPSDARDLRLRKLIA